jgi:hypothetical protein
MTFPPALLGLSDNQIAIVMAHAHPLQSCDRPQFLQAVADRLTGFTELGDGLVARACRELQRGYFDPPNLGGRGAHV